MTPTSATGERGSKGGFTLVELMVVVAILGVLASVVIVSAPDARPSLAAEAEQLSVRLTRARQEAVLSNRTIEAAVDRAGYRFAVVSAGLRRPIGEGPFRPVEWIEGTAPEEPVRIAFDPTGLAAPARVRLIRDGRLIEVAVGGGGEARVHAPR